MILSLLAALALAAGSAAGEFDAVSVKPSPPDARSKVDVTPGRFVATGVTLRELARIAFPVDAGRLRSDDELVTSEGWMGAERFDLVATGAPANIARPAPGAVAPPESAALDDVRAMLRAVLADRFAMTTRHESRQLSIYRLVRARSNGVGPRLRDAAQGCDQPPRDESAACGGFRFLGPGHLAGRAVTMPMLVSLLAGLPIVGRMVEDGTGLPGAFDVDLMWTNDAAGPALVTAIQEQLGLRLEATRGPVDVLIVEHASRPTAN